MIIKATAEELTEFIKSIVGLEKDVQIRHNEFTQDNRKPFTCECTTAKNRMPYKNPTRF